MNSSTTIKRNFAWSSVLTIAGYVFPLITFPYVTRVLGVEGIGSYQSADSIIQYFSVFSMLGVSTVGIREIARVKTDKKEMSCVFSSLMLLNFVTTLFSIGALLLLSFIIPSFSAHKQMIYIGIARILCGSLLVEWFFKGIEDFQFITIRALIVRCVYVISVFLFVRDQDDVVVYFTLTTLITVVNAVINIVYSRRFVPFSLSRLKVRSYIKPVLTLGIYQILTAMYISFNVIYLGAKCGDVEVGYYSTATKLYGIVMSLFTAFTGVMLPRMSSLLAEGKDSEFKDMTSKSIDFLLLFCLPLIVIAEVYAPQIIRIIAGDGYDGAIIPMRIVIPLMFVIGYEQIIIIQMLSPLRKDNAILTNSSIGAGVALLLNFTIVPRLGSIGSAIVWCCSELAVLLSAQFFVTKYTGYCFPVKRVLRSVLFIIPLVFVCILLNRTLNHWLISFVSGSAFVFLYYALIEYFVIHNKLLINNLMRARNRLKVRHGE